MEDSGGKLIKIVLGVLVLGIVACGAYGAGFGSGYYAHTRLSPQSGVACAVCPTPAAAVDCSQTAVLSGAPATDFGPTPEEEQAFSLFWEVWTALQDNYYGDLPDTEEMTNGAIRGVLQTLDDQFTSYIEPNLARVINEDASGSFEGIGALVRMNPENRLEITRPYENQPADKAGLKSGDIVIAIDGQSIVDYGLYEAIGLIRGPAGSKVVLTVERAGVDAAFDVTVTRAKIEIPIVESEMLEGDIAYVRLFEFSAPASQRTEAALEALLDQKPKGLIFDLRDNPGGYLQQAIEVSDLFLKTGLVAIERASDGREEIFRATSKGIAQDIPMVVLVNAGSASASEIVAGALQDNDRAKLIGEQTFGKGSVQLPYTLSNEGELRITIARWFTPDDRAIHNEGLTPDIEATFTEEDAEAGRDPQLDRALEYFKLGK